MTALTRLLPCLALTTVSTAAWAAGGGEHAAGGPDAGRLALQLINFGLLLFILVKFAGGAMNKALRARHEQLKSDMEDASRRLATAEERFKQQETRLARLAHEATAMRSAMVEDARREGAQIVAAAEDRARRIQDETRFLLDQQVKEAALRFRRELTEAALRLAEQRIAELVTSSDEQRLLRWFVAEVAAPPREGSAG